MRTLLYGRLFNEAYALDISRKVRAQARQSMKVGDYIGGRAPYGYQKHPDHCHKLIVDPETAPVVLEMFQWAAEGVGLNLIVQRLNLANVLSPSKYAAGKGILTHEKLVSDGKWQTRTVRKILDCELYTGDMVQGKTTSIGGKQVLTEREAWIIVPNTHEAIISHALFEAAQKGLAERSTRCTVTVKDPYSTNVLRGRIFCGHCGKNLHRQKSHNNYMFYCISNSRVAKGVCPGVSIKEPILFEAVLNIIRMEAKLFLDKSALLLQKDSKLEALRREVEQAIAKEKKRMEDSRFYLKNLHENLVTGVLTGLEYIALKQDYQGQIQCSVQKIQTLELRQKDLTAQLARVATFAERLERITPNSELSRRMVEELIARITVYDATHIEIQFSFQDGFAALEEVLSVG